MALSAKKAAYGGLLTCLALIFSYIETFIPLNFLVHIPGFKLGFANICVLLSVFSLGISYGMFVMLSKVFLSALLFGNPMSFLFSLGGSVLSFVFLSIAKRFLKDKVSFVGISVACAALHNTGQICVAGIIFGDPAVFLYLEWLLPVSVVTGIITGIIVQIVSKYTEKVV